ncbi:MAG: MerR family transcriptional regulator [Bacteroidales bacterium]|nr:MerR family transcriptional regulator [Bacteroidales bacterium]
MEKKLYYSIGEVAAMLGVRTSVLRFWESEFDCLKPVKTSRGARNYTNHDIELLRRIHYLTRECGYTLEGAREQMRTRPIEDPRMALVNSLTEVRDFLVELKEQL